MLKKKEIESLKKFEPITFKGFTVRLISCFILKDPSEMAFKYNLDCYRELKPDLEVTQSDGKISLNPKKVLVDWGTKVKEITRSHKILIKGNNFDNVMNDFKKIFSCCRYGRFNYVKLKKMKGLFYEMSYGWDNEK